MKFGAEEIAKHPEIATRVAQIISEWALIDQTLAMIAANCLATERIGVVSAMLREIRSSEAMRAVLQSVVTHSLAGSSDGDLFSAIYAVVGQERRTRNNLAHWSMGHCDDTPTKLVLGEPQALLRLVDKTHEQWRIFLHQHEAGEALEALESGQDPPKLGRDGLWVLSKNGARIILREAKRCHRLLSQFWLVLILRQLQPERADELRQQIRSDTRIQSALDNDSRTPDSP